ncbi:MAG: fibronectin type III domain-containing protein, partial [candidate division Zixibacteria bacterium]|nr:fibronectin type III domain-containing protein [candidate division Zixibacteria bacterium]
MRIVAVIVVLLLVVGENVTAQNKYDQQSYSKKAYPTQEANSSESVLISSQDEWPVYSVRQSTSKFSATVTSIGKVDSYDSDEPAFEFPPGSGFGYLWDARLWIGGIIGEDTLVSLAYGFYQWWDETREYYIGTGRQSFYPSEATPYDMRALYPIDVGTSDSYRTEFVDTFTTGFDGLLTGHTPLNLKVLQKSYCLDVNPYRNILLLDFTVTNIGTEIIKEAYVGVIIDADAYSVSSDNGYEDDLMGSLRNINTCYAIDNDGDPYGGYFTAGISPVDGLGFRPTRIYPPVTDTNFNWWIVGYDWSFGPRQQGTLEEPYREFSPAGTGAPCTDPNRYYLLSHREWDYDQVMSATIGPSDSMWMYQDQGQAQAVSHGADGLMLMSIGPVDLLPDSSMRAVFALFGSEFIHIDPTNYLNLAYDRWETFYDNLHFGVLRSTAEKALELTDSILSPMTHPPTGLELVKLSSDTALLQWDPWVFPDVLGYNIYLTQIEWPSKVAGAGSYQNLTLAASPPDSFYTITRTGREQIVGLQPRQLYFVSVAHVTQSGEGALSQPILLGNINTTLESAPIDMKREFAFYTEEDPSVKLEWEPPENGEVLYYNIYKAADSAESVARYESFIAFDTSGIPYEHAFSVEYGDRQVYFYQIQAYDSTDITTYVDQNPDEGSYYWVTAVLSTGGETSFSDLVKCEKTLRKTRDIVVILGATSGQMDFVHNDSIINFYRNLLDGYDFDLYNWNDTNLIRITCPSEYCTNWLDLSPFRMVIVEEFPSPKILSGTTEPVHKLLTRLIDAGQNLAYFGIPPGNEHISPTTTVEVIVYDTGSFEAQYLGLDSTEIRSWSENYGEYDAIDTLAGFNGALPVTDEWPILRYDTSGHYLKEIMEVLFVDEPCLPLTPVFLPDEETEILYSYQSLYPNSSQLSGKPCGLRNRRNKTDTYAFSFHLWAMESSGARALIDQLMTGIPTDTEEHRQLLKPGNLELAQ